MIIITMGRLVFLMRFPFSFAERDLNYLRGFSTMFYFFSEREYIITDIFVGMYS